ncbi:MAG: acylphosphatase [Candidatus Tectimicrobiota bacterium]
MIVRKRLRITGHVQGVGFRAATIATARSLGLRGWVRNRADGCVEAVAEGEETAVAALAHWCQQGPPAARVEQVEIADEPQESALPSSFAVR